MNIISCIETEIATVLRIEQVLVNLQSETTPSRAPSKLTFRVALACRPNGRHGDTMRGLGNGQMAMLGFVPGPCSVM
jgi:hypothetical protein